MMEQVAIGQKAAIERITTIVEVLMPTKPLFQEALDAAQTIQMLSDLVLKNASPEDVMAMSADRLSKILCNVMVIEATAGMLNDLTPEQIAIFDAAVAGR